MKVYVVLADEDMDYGQGSCIIEISKTNERAQQVKEHWEKDINQFAHIEEWEVED